MSLIKVDLGNIGEFAKPVDTLIKKISGAIGTIYEPHHIKKLAEAEAAAGIIRAEGDIKKSELQQRAVNRLLHEETKKQINIENITKLALPFVEESARPEDVDDDWYTHFFDRGRLISDEQMQELWGKILAGKANSPGSFSKRTVDIVAALEKTDASLFEALMRVSVGHGLIYPLIFDQAADPIYHSIGIHFSSLSHLDSAGLVHFNWVGGYKLDGYKQETEVLYFNRRIKITFPKPEGNSLQLGNGMLTKAGWDLAPLCDTRPIDGFPEFVAEKWKRYGIVTGITSAE